MAENRYKNFSLEQLSEIGMFPKELVPYLRQKARTSPMVFIAGKRWGTGRTSLMSAMLDEIQAYKLGTVIRNSDALSVRNQNMTQHTLNLYDGAGNLCPNRTDLVTVPDTHSYFIIERVRLSELSAFMKMAYAGKHCWAIAHKSIVEALPHYMNPENECPKGIVIFMDHFQICEISEITGCKQGELRSKSVFKTNSEYTAFASISQAIASGNV